MMMAVEVSTACMKLLRLLTSSYRMTCINKKKSLMAAVIVINHLSFDLIYDWYN